MSAEMLNDQWLKAKLRITALHESVFYRPLLAATAELEATEGPTGEYYGDSEWAKNVFSGLLFPPGQASILVPYIPEQRREDLIAGVLNLNTMDANNTAPAPSPGADPSTSSEPGLPTNPDAVPGPQ
jgi:hypothetical protein